MASTVIVDSPTSSFVSGIDSTEVRSVEAVATESSEVAVVVLASESMDEDV